MDDLPPEVTDMVRRLAIKLAWRCRRDPDDLLQEGLLAAWLLAAVRRRMAS